MRPALFRHSLPSTLLLVTIAFLSSARAAAAHAPATASPLIAIQPLGHLDPALIEAVTRRIRETFAVRVVVLPSEPLPQSAYYRPRQRYRGERLLDWLEAHRPAPASKILGLMSRDLSVTKGQVYDWGVMGVAGLSRPAGIVSVHRLRSHYASPARVARRTSQVAVHELGHTFGLPHCRAARCIMNDAQGGIGPVDASSGRFCPRCLARLERGGFTPRVVSFSHEPATVFGDPSSRHAR